MHPTNKAAEASTHMNLLPDVGLYTDSGIRPCRSEGERQSQEINYLL